MKIPKYSLTSMRKERPCGNPSEECHRGVRHCWRDCKGTGPPKSGVLTKMPVFPGKPGNCSCGKGSSWIMSIFESKCNLEYSACNSAKKMYRVLLHCKLLIGWVLTACYTWQGSTAHSYIWHYGRSSKWDPLADLTRVSNRREQLKIEWTESFIGVLT